MAYWPTSNTRIAQIFVRAGVFETMAEWALAMIDGATHEAVLFAAIGFLLGGIDDLATPRLSSHTGGESLQTSAAASMISKWQQWWT